MVSSIASIYGRRDPSKFSLLLLIPLHILMYWSLGHIHASRYNLITYRIHMISPVLWKKNIVILTKLMNHDHMAFP